MQQKIKNFFVSKKYILYTLPFARYIPFLYPNLLSIFLTTKCNLKCFFCRDEYIGLTLDIENIKKLKRPIKYAKIIDLTGWGECFSYINFKEALAYIMANNNSRCIMITTNGTLLTSDYGRLLRGKLCNFVISLNAATQETYERDMINGNFQKTINAIKSFIAELDEDDKKCTRLHFVAHKNNYVEIKDFVELAKSFGIQKVSIGHLMIRDSSQTDLALINCKDEYNNSVWAGRALAEKYGMDFYYRRFFSDKEKWRDVQDCNDPFNNCYVEPDGRVAPCCFCGSYRIGNAYQTSFEDVWFSKEYNKLRKNRYLEICKACVPFVPFDEPLAHLGSYYKEDGTVVGREKK